MNYEVMERNADEEMVFADAALKAREEEKAKARRRRANFNRKSRDEAMRSCGLVKCRVNGKVFWE